ncbi:hypothetical protein NX059_003461 [Plenodomus lindquistii]|nr:hypothetical protein NX059_003461 [Plenodomus lindquistii]
MLALRSLARSAPRAAARLSTNAARQPALVRPSAAFQPAWTAAMPRLTCAFSLSARRLESSAVNDELVAKLQSEISIEEDMREDDDLSTNIKDYLDNSPFELQDKPGHQEVVMTRTFGDEKITLSFSTADLNNNPSEDELAEDSAMYDDADIEGQSGGASTKGAINQGRTQDGNVRVAPEDRVSPADREDLEDDYDDDAQQQGFPVHASIRIERAGKGALSIEATAQDGDFLIEDLIYFPTADLADPATAEKEWQRRTLYTGPPFNNLDEDLQILLEKYLEERGINTRLALFIPDYIDHKEQKEYVRWLDNVKNFVA